MERFNNIKKEDKKVFITLSPDYPNVGDIAISIIQTQILKDVFPDRKIIEIPLCDFESYKKEMKKIINNEDIITIIGGGNMGNVWIACEEIRRDIINSFPNNKIFSFPQSIDFEENEHGKNEFQKSIEIYKKHPNLTIFSREEKSFNIMKENFYNEVFLVPDLVMHFCNKLNNEKMSRDAISLCFRSDKEKITSHNILEQFEIMLKNNNYTNIKKFDTVINDLKFTTSEKEEIFEKTLNNFRNSKVVVTDRLHGMIFALITKTPCIALDNSNHKISATYNTWLKDVPYIKLLENFDENKIIDLINEFNNIDLDSIKVDFTPHYDQLYKSLKGGNL